MNAPTTTPGAGARADAERARAEAAVASLDALVQAIRLYGPDHGASRAGAERLARLLAAPLRLTIHPGGFRHDAKPIHSAIASLMHSANGAALEFEPCKDVGALIRAAEVLAHAGEEPAHTAWCPRVQEASGGCVRAHALDIRSVNLDDAPNTGAQDTLAELAPLLENEHDTDPDGLLASVRDEAARAQTDSERAERLRASIERLGPACREKLLRLGAARPGEWTDSIPGLLGVWPEGELVALIASIDADGRTPSDASGLLFARLGAILSASPELHHKLRQQIGDHPGADAGPVLRAVADLLASPAHEAYNSADYSMSLESMAATAPSASPRAIPETSDPDSVEVRATEIALLAGETDHGDAGNALLGLLPRIGVLCARSRFDLLTRGLRLARAVETRDAPAEAPNGDEPDPAGAAKSVLDAIESEGVIRGAMGALVNARTGAGGLLNELGVTGVVSVCRHAAHAPSDGVRRWLAQSSGSTLGSAVARLLEPAPDVASLTTLAEALSSQRADWPARLVVWGLGQERPELVRGAVAGIARAPTQALTPHLLAHLISDRAGRLGRAHCAEVIGQLERLTNGAIRRDLARILIDNAMRPAAVRSGLCEALATALARANASESSAALLAWRLNPLRLVLRRQGGRR